MGTSRNASGITPGTQAPLIRTVAAKKRLRDAAPGVLTEKRCHALFDALAEGVVMIAADGRVIAANASAETVLGMNAREIERVPDVLLIGQPTRGVDIGAIEFIHQQIIALRDAGKAILLVSVELDEIMSLSDRIGVMFDGRLMGIKNQDQTNVNEIGLMMAGIEAHEDGAA